MIELFSSYLDLLLFQPAVMFTVNQYTLLINDITVDDRTPAAAEAAPPPQ